VPAPTEAFLTSAGSVTDDDDRAGGVAHEVLAHRPDQESCDLTVAAAADDEQTRLV
jgi:hypothetical protein